MSLCARCHELGKGCCVLYPGYDDNQFSLIESEIATIESAMGLPREKFVAEDTASEGFLRVLDKIHPVFRRTMPAGRRQHLKVVNGHCVLLGPRGCLLSPEQRPVYCALYPFWFDAHDRILLLRSQLCMAQQDAISLFEVMRRLEMNETVLRRRFQLFCEAVDAQDGRL